MKTLAFYNNKGGCAKTTTAINVAYALSKAGRKILVVDCDSQHNAHGFFAKEQNGEIQSTRYENIDIAIWSGELLGAERYDFIILDLPPAMNDYVREILARCDYVFVPMEVGTFSIQGMTAVTDAIAEAGVGFGGCFAAKFDKSNTSDLNLLELIEQNLGDRAMRSRIPYSKVIKNSINYRLTAFEYMGYTNAAISLGDLTEEILERIGE